MYEIHILREGYSLVTDEGFKANGTITLIKGKKNIIVDTGNPLDKDIIISALGREGLQPDDIDVVVGTHGHSDHVGNLNIFPRALFIVCYDICHGDLYIDNDLSKGGTFKIDADIDVIPTPGHTGSDVSVIVRNTTFGTVAIAGDLFEAEGDLENPSLWRSVSERPEEQEKNRRKVLQLADYIVPGHGAIFSVPISLKPT